MLVPVQDAVTATTWINLRGTAAARVHNIPAPSVQQKHRLQFGYVHIQQLGTCMCSHPIQNKASTSHVYVSAEQVDRTYGVQEDTSAVPATATHSITTPKNIPHPLRSCGSCRALWAQALSICTQALLHDGADGTPPECPPANTPQHSTWQNTHSRNLPACCRLRQAAAPAGSGLC